MEMGEFKKYVFRKYSDRFPALFVYEKRRLQKILPTALIEHFGSSAVPNLGGKGIVDVIISVPKRSVNAALKKLIDHGYERHCVGGGKEREFLVRVVKYHDQQRLVHVHLTNNGSRVWRMALAVREYLRRDKMMAMEYARVKQRAAREAKGDGKKYRQLKRGFLVQLKRKALR